MSLYMFKKLHLVKVDTASKFHSSWRVVWKTKSW